VFVGCHGAIGLHDLVDQTTHLAQGIERASGVAWWKSLGCCRFEQGPFGTLIAR
jgi:hypothetical protein